MSCELYYPLHNTNNKNTQSKYDVIINIIVVTYIRVWLKWPIWRIKVMHNDFESRTDVDDTERRTIRKKDELNDRKGLRECATAMYNLRWRFHDTMRTVPPCILSSMPRKEIVLSRPLFGFGPVPKTTKTARRWQYMYIHRYSNKIHPGHILLYALSCSSCLPIVFAFTSPSYKRYYIVGDSEACSSL